MNNKIIIVVSGEQHSRNVHRLTEALRQSGCNGDISAVSCSEAKTREIETILGRNDVAEARHKRVLNGWPR